MTLKINRQGVVSDSSAPAPAPVAERLAEAEAEVTELQAEQPAVVVEHPADGTMSPPVSNDAPAEPPAPPVARAPVAPPRRVPRTSGV